MNFEFPDSRVRRRPEELLADVREVLPWTRRVRLLAGTVLVDGLVGFIDGVGEVQIDILIRNPETQPLDEALIDHPSGPQADMMIVDRAKPRPGTAERALEAARQLVRHQLELIDQAPETERAIMATLKRLERGSVSIRILLQGDTPTKLILFEGAQTVAISGNNPLTSRTDRASMYVVSRSTELFAQVASTFSELWEVSHAAEQPFVNEFRTCWAAARPTPYEVYVQMLHHFADADALDAGRLVWSHPLFDALADFQRDAVKQAVAMVQRHGGAFVADVVGLGKSFVGAAVLKYFEHSEGLRPLIVCPAPLVEMWENYNELWELGARVVSTGMLVRDSKLAAAFRLETGELKTREIVLIDESHQFRNNGTQRYELLSQFLSAGRRVVMLTATPLNRSCWDVYHQMKLFHQHERTQIPVSPPLLKDYFDRVESGRARLQELLSHVLVRRTRREITRAYARDAVTERRIDPKELDEYSSGRKRAYFELNGRRFSFPRRQLRTVAYSLEETYAGVYDRIRRHLSPPSAGAGGLNYARYCRHRYVLPQFQALHGKLGGTANNLSGLMRVLLFKRLESSTNAFAATVTRMMTATQRLIRLIDGTGAQDPAGNGSIESALEEDLDLRLAELEQSIKLEHLDRARFVRDLRLDEKVLLELLSVVQPIEPSRNAKLVALHELLQSGPLADQKVLIFSQFADTAVLIHDQVRSWFPADVVELCSSTTSNRASVTARFAPKANSHLRPRFPGSEVRVLVCTDVLSEGVNLQDCSVAINFDLHWNPVRLIQRFGRVDRIGTEHEEIQAFNFLPELALDRNLGLRQCLANRIKEIHELVGEDAAILDPAEQVNEQAMYAIYEGRTVSDEELEGAASLSSVQDGIGVLAGLKETDPALLANIAARPLALRAARVADSGREGAIVLLRAGGELRFIWCEPGRVPSAYPSEDAVKAIACHPAEPGLAIPNWLGDSIERARSDFLSHLQEREGERRIRPRLRVGQREVVDRLRDLAEAAASDDLRQRAAELAPMVDGDIPDAVVKALRFLNQRDLPSDGFLSELARLCLSHHMNRRRDLRTSGELPAIEVVATMAFVGG